MAIKPKNPIFGNWWKGIGFSKYDTAFFDALTNADIISEVGSLKCNFGLKKDSGTTITEQCLQVVCPSGIIYFFSQSSGSIWKRSTVGTYSSVTANANGAHAGCGFYNGYVYYADNTTKLGRFNPDTEGNRNDSWKSFTNSGFPRPMKVQNNILHIGDYNNVFTVNASDSISATALVLNNEFTVSAFHNYGYDLLVMTYAGAYRNNAGIFRWDTSSSSWSSEYYLAEPAINIVIPTDRTDIIFIQAGTAGNIYEFDGSYLNFWKQVRGVTTTANGHMHDRTCAFNRKHLFSIGANIYSISQPQPNMDFALNMEYVCSQGSGATIWSLGALGNSTLIATWTASGSGVDVIDTNYATASVAITLVSQRIHDIIIYTDSLPTGTSIGLEINPDGTGWISKAVVVDSADQFVVKCAVDIANKRTVQARVTLNPNNSVTPATPSVSHIEFIPYPVPKQ